MLLLLVALISFSCTEEAAEKAPEATKEIKEVKKYKMITQTPPGVLIPDEVETRLVTLKFFDEYPTQETADKIYDQLNFQRLEESIIFQL